MNELLPEAEKPFPVHSAEKWPGCPKFIRWSALNEEWAQRNHSQSLKRLAERGGLDPCEIVGNIEHIPWGDIKMDLESAINTISHFEMKS